jgi:uncharacterized membrane protein
MIREGIYALVALGVVIMMTMIGGIVYYNFAAGMLPIGAGITDPTYKAGILTLPTNLNRLVIFSFLTLIIGFIAYIFLIPWRTEVKSPYEGA